MRPAGLLAYRVASALAAPLAPALLQARARRGKEDPERLGERLGQAGRARPEGDLVWLHAASVGEGLSLLPVITALMQRRPETAILATTGTTTAAALLGARLPAEVIHQYAPIDGPGATASFLEAWRPRLGVFVESEIWPNLIEGARARGVALALLSARLSETSLRQWRLAPRTARRLFGAFDLVMAQDDAVARRLQALGARHDGLINLKRHMAPLPVDDALVADVRRRLGAGALLLAASTHEGEEVLVLSAFRAADASAALVLAPRHPDRGDEIEALARREGFEVRRRSRGDAFDPQTIYLADTMGELGAWFSVARAAFIGGSLVEGPGGHNPLEAAQLRCPVIAGPHVGNWREIYADLEANDAVRRVSDRDALALAFGSALQTPAILAAQAARAQALADAGGSGLTTAVDRLLDLLK